MGLELLDEVVLEQEGVFFGLDHGIGQVGDVLDERAGLAVKLLRRAEILRNAPFQVLGLAHVDDLSGCVEVAVDARVVRKIFYFLSDIHRKILSLLFDVSAFHEEDQDKDNQ